MDMDVDGGREHFLSNAFGEKYLYSVNRNAFCKLGSFAVYQAHFRKDFPRDNYFYVFSGTDSGLLPQYLLQRGIPEGTKFLFVELPEVLERLPEVLDLEAHPRIHYTTLEALPGMLNELACNEYVWADSAEKRRSLCTSDAYLPAYMQLDQATQFVFTELVFMIRNALGNKLFWVRQLENLAENQHAVSCLRGLFPQKTCVLLGIGPSLHEVLPWVQAHRDDLFVMAVSRAAKPLAAAGLTPDLFISIDPKELSFDVSREMLHAWQDVVFAHSHHASPILVAQWRGRRLYLGNRFFWPTSQNEEMFAYSGPTVTQWGVSVALEMGFSQLVLGGVDLCFGREGQHYAQGEARGVGAKVGDVRDGVETNGGWLAESCIPYVTGAKVLERQAAQALERGCRIVNPAAGAMKITHVAYLPLDELKVEPLERPARQTLEAALPSDTREGRLGHYQAMAEELQRYAARLRALQHLAESGLKALKRFFPTSGKVGHIKHKHALDRIEREIKQEFADLVNVVQAYAVLRFLKVLKGKAADRSDLSPDEMRSTWRMYYEAYRDGCQDLLDLIERAATRLNARREEEVAQPDFARLVKQWQADLQFGRYLVWQDHCPSWEQALGAADRALLAQLEEKFERIMRHEENLSGEFVKPQESLAEKKTKARYHFSIKDQRGLEVLQTGLRGDANCAGTGLDILVRGYLCELGDQPEQALAAYEQLLGEDTQELQEDALLRILALSLASQDLPNALLALECLAGMALVYAPKLGDLLWLLGERGRALDVYADYLEQMPEDLQSYLRLGTYYRDAGLPEGARVVFAHVLELDPGNVTAARFLADLPPLHAAGAGGMKRAAFFTKDCPRPGR